MRTDSKGNIIGDGKFHTAYDVIDFSDYPQITIKITESNTSETVYIQYTNTENSQNITVRFSWHENNAVRFGDQLNGFLASKNEILAHLGLKKRTFVANTYLSISKICISKKKTHLYSECDLSISEMYAMGVGADLSNYTNKLAKGSNFLITGSPVELLAQTRQNALGAWVEVGDYIYED